MDTLKKDCSKSYRANSLLPENNIFDNKLIFGDNLLVLKALESEYRGKIKCIYIDPPYNTNKTFTHYKDKLDSKDWLEFMRSRLELMHQLLADDGSIWVTIDDNECHYLKVLMDEIFDRKNFIANCIWEKIYTPKNNGKWLSDNHDHILCFAKNKNRWRPNLLPRTKDMNKRYQNLDNDPRGKWLACDISIQRYNHIYDYQIITPSGRVVNPPKGACWRMTKEKYKELVNDNRIWFGKDGNNKPLLKRFRSEIRQGVVSMTIWKHKDVGHNCKAKREIKALHSTEVFDTPKPEKLIKRILDLATKENDIVLDAFLGSGTTTAVAHKMNRQYIGIENGTSFENVCVPRMQQVVDGEQGGISKLVGWKGGGGFNYYAIF